MTEQIGYAEARVDVSVSGDAAEVTLHVDRDELARLLAFTVLTCTRHNGGPVHEEPLRRLELDVGAYADKGVVLVSFRGEARHWRGASGCTAMLRGKRWVP